MTKEDLLIYKKQLLELNKKEAKLRLLYLRNISNDTYLGPMVGYPEIDMPGLKAFTEEQILFDIPEKLLVDTVIEYNKDNLDTVAINFMDNEITYREMTANIEKCIRSFSAMGIKKGDAVTFCCPTTPEIIYMFYALNYLGAVANFVDLRTNAERIVQYINDSKSKIIVSNDNVLKKVNGLIDQTSAGIIINADTSISLPKKVKPLYKIKTIKNVCISKDIMSYSAFMQKGKRIDPSSIEKVDYNPDTAALVVYTGGTTGIPKGAILTNKGINSTAFNYMNSGFNREAGQKFVDIMPPFIAYGFVVGIHLPLLCGFTNIIIPKFNPNDIGRTIMHHKPQHFIGVPTHFEHMMNDPLLKDKDLSFLINCGVGGDSINPSKERAINEFLRAHNCNNMLRIGYGMTENSSGSITDINNETTKIGSVGLPLVNNTVKIVNPETLESLGYNESGEIYITGPQLMKGYLNNEAETSKVFVYDEFGTKWIKSGDYGYMDEDGNVFIEGRIKNMIVRPDGHNVYPLTVASVLSECEFIDEAVVVGIKSKFGYEGTIPTAYVILKDGYEPSIEVKNAILEFQSHHLPERDGALDIRFVKEFPLTPIGKVDVKRIVAEEKELSDVNFEELAALSKRKKIM